MLYSNSTYSLTTFITILTLVTFSFSKNFLSFCLSFSEVFPQKHMLQFGCHYDIIMTGDFKRRFNAFITQLLGVDFLFRLWKDASRKL